MCRKSGYELIRSSLTKERVPSISTIARRIAHIKAHSGVQHEMLNCIRDNPKCQSHPDAVLIINEMAVEPRVEYSAHSRSLMGLTTLAPIKPQFVATNLFVFYLSGILCNYKFPVGHHLTGDTIDPIELNFFSLSFWMHYVNVE